MNFFHTEISYRNYFSYYKNAENYGLKYIFGVALVYFIDTPDYLNLLFPKGIPHIYCGTQYSGSTNPGHSVEQREYSCKTEFKYYLCIFSWCRYLA